MFRQNGPAVSFWLVFDEKKRYTFVINPKSLHIHAHGWRNLSQSGGHKCTSKNYRKILWFELVTVASQALKYDVTTYTPYDGLNYTISDKITPLWKRIGEPHEIQIGCYRGDPGQQRHSGSSYEKSDFILTE